MKNIKFKCDAIIFGGFPQMVITALTLNVAGFRRSHVFLVFSHLKPLVNRRRLLPRKHWSAGVTDSYYGNIALLALVLSESKVQH